jgi:hypothetical protein
MGGDDCEAPERGWRVYILHLEYYIICSEISTILTRLS